MGGGASGAPPHTGLRYRKFPQEVHSWLAETGLFARELYDGLAYWSNISNNGTDVVLDDSQFDPGHDFTRTGSAWNDVASPLGIDGAVQFTESDDFALELENSDGVTHWSKPGSDDALSGYVAIRYDAHPSSGLRTIVGNWASNSTSTWRLKINGTSGELRLGVVTDRLVEENVDSGYSLTPGEVYHIFWEINNQANEGELWVHDSRGAQVSYSSAQFSSASRQSSSGLHLGEHGMADVSSCNCTVDLLGFWTRELTGSERSVIVNGGSGVRFADVLLHPVPEDPGYRMDRVAGCFKGNTRHVFVGDSLMTSGAGRIPWGMLMGNKWENLTTITHGMATGALVKVVHEDYGTAGPIEVDSLNSWEVEGGAMHYGLPVANAHEVKGDPAALVPGDDMFFSIAIMNGHFTGETERFTKAGDSLSVRPIYRDAGAMQWPDYQLVETGGDASAVFGDFIGGEEDHAWMGSADLIVDANMTANPGFKLGQQFADDVDTNHVGKYMTMLGHTITRQGQVGPHWSMLGFRSWTYAGHGNNTASTGNKRYTTQELRHWLEATTVDANARHIFWLHCDTEDATVATNETNIRNFAQKVETACTDAGIDEWRVVVLVAYEHTRGVFSPDGQKKANQDLWVAAKNVSDDNGNVCVFSLHYAVDGIFMNGSPEAEAWLTEHGYTAFTYGSNTVDLVAQEGSDLLDFGEVHPKNENCAAFWASLVGKHLPDDSRTGGR